MTSDQQQARIADVTTPTDREIHIERVFAVYTDPKLIPEWWGPRGTTAVVDEMDVRPGGRWRFIIRVVVVLHGWRRWDRAFGTCTENHAVERAGIIRRT